MAVRKPVERITSTIDIDELISRGSPVSEDKIIEDKEKKSKSKKSTHINLRIPKDMLNKIDEIMKTRVGISRIGWILETIQKQIEEIENVRFM